MNRKMLKIFLLCFAVSLVVVACGNQAPAGDNANSQNDTNSTTGSSGSDDTTNADAGDPVSVAQAFWTAIFSGEGEVAATYVCEFDLTGINTDTIGELFGAVNLGPVEIDTSNLNYSLVSEDGDTAEVEISGELLIGVAGTDQQTPTEFQTMSLFLVNEDGWKVCTEQLQSS